MIKKTACYILLTLCSMPAFSADATPNDFGSKADNASNNGNGSNGTSNGSGGNSGNTTNTTPTNPGDEKNTITDPNHPMVYCREHTC